MGTQNVNLTSELAKFVRSQVESGMFNNASEVHRAALADMARKEEERTVRLERLRGEIQFGIDEVEAGQSVEMTNPKEIRRTLDDCYERATERLEAENAEALG